jgi:hypothetical protein
LAKAVGAGGPDRRVVAVIASTPGLDSRLVGPIDQNFIAVPASHVLSVVPMKGPFGWSELMPNLFFHQRYPPKITYR